ncbi:L-aspartate oxidase [Alteribacter aurantiacus]|uniref:L-aspartate oxidase n=1 Tax=Alteribacter aurantiacus TaxID=254410 RepID=UPI0003FA8BD8|nr:L-aspartate oxidase [Alteribacter aurantiacus]
MEKKTVIILGSGLAALTTAKELSTDCDVIIFTKQTQGSSWRAQGGIAAAIDENDHPNLHLEDTLFAGVDHCNQEAATILVKEGTQAVREWLAEGMAFDKDNKGALALSLEGAHSVRRILHAGGDQTGKRMMEHRVGTCLSIALVSDKSVVDLIIKEGSCKGISVKTKAGEVEHVFGDAVVIATGGYGGLYETSSTDPGLVGEGIALAYRAGARLSDLEFTQFHPTLLWTNNGGGGLVSEAVRGEGGILVNDQGDRIMAHYELKDLAPRDVVARVLYENVKQGRKVYLDISGVPQFTERFPTITSMCKNAGINLDEKKIPVRPGAHFSIGGIHTDVNGCSSVHRLYAIGEVACTGVHGANRLASNSLLETIVFGKRAAKHILKNDNPQEHTLGTTRRVNLKPTHFPDQTTIRRVITDKVGIEKDNKGLTRAIAWFEDHYVKHHLHSLREQWTDEEIERSNMLIVGWLLASSSLLRTESRGTHYRCDYPFPNRDRWLGERVFRHISEKISTTAYESERGNGYEQVDA